MPEDFETMLTGGHHNSLGRTEEVATLVITDPDRLEELYGCYESDDEVVRLRTSSALKRVQAANPRLLLPYYDRLIDEIGNLNQASAQWTLAILFKVGRDNLTNSQIDRARALMQRNLQENPDWIVLNMTMETLTEWSAHDQGLRGWLIPELQRISNDRRKSVKARATKFLRKLGA